MIQRLKGGQEWIIHILAKNLKEVDAAGKPLPVVAIRSASSPDKYLVVRHVEILGPSALFHTPEDPVPGTDGRAVCVLRTSAPLRIWVDD
jgi:hypothetical protein